ncbi:sialate O-acetylesterase, partial [Tabrizicola fusiformis]|uniref:sialate O-acetylesterase n=1 Tax=Tabrizicola sp. SY72 TaxID=2741673 RepID=UPI0019D59F8D
TAADRVQTGLDRTVAGQEAQVAAGHRYAAEAAAVTAASAAAFYDTIAAGRAAVADGSSFGVRAGGSDGLARPSIYRRDSSASQTLIVELAPGSELSAEVAARTDLVRVTNGQTLPDGRAVVAVEVDALGRVRRATLPDGIEVDFAGREAAGQRYRPDGDAMVIEVAEVEIGRDRAVEAPSDIVWAPVSDPHGRLPLSIDAAGAVRLTPAEGSLDDYLAVWASRQGLPAQPRPVICPDLMAIVVYGQSLAAGVASTLALTTVQPFDNLMPSGGLFDGPVNDQGPTGAPVAAAFEPLRYIQQNANLGENVAYGGANMLRAQTGQRVLAHCAAYGGRSIAQLSAGTTYHTWLLQAVAQHRALALASGLTYGLGAIWWLQGETDATNSTPIATYKAALAALIDSINAASGQTHPAVLLTYQTASHTVRDGGRPPEIAIAQWQAATEHDQIMLVAPTYHLAYNADDVHLPPHSTRWLSQYYARVTDIVCVQGREWRPLEPIRATRAGRIVDITYHVPVAPLVLDPGRVNDPGNYGFTVVTAGGAALTIESVALRGATAVRIVLAADPGAEVTVRYAWGANGEETGRWSGARGCLRDSDPTQSYHLDAVGRPYELFNWCVISQIQTEQI